LFISDWNFDKYETWLSLFISSLNYIRGYKKHSEMVLSYAFKCQYQ